MYVTLGPMEFEIDFGGISVVTDDFQGFPRALQERFLGIRGMFVI